MCRKKRTGIPLAKARKVSVGFYINTGLITANTHIHLCTYHVFHANADFSITVKSSVEAHYIGRVTFMQNLQLTNDLVPNSWFDF